MKRTKLFLISTLLIAMLMIPNASAFWGFEKVVDWGKQTFSKPEQKQQIQAEPVSRPTIVIMDGLPEANERSMRSNQNQVQNEVKIQSGQPQTQGIEGIRLTEKINPVEKFAVQSRSNLCVNAGGSWYYSDDMIGCIGADSWRNCDNKMVGMAQKKCESIGATFVCSKEQGLYCQAS